MASVFAALEARVLVPVSSDARLVPVRNERLRSGTIVCGGKGDYQPCVCAWDVRVAVREANETV